MADTQPKLAGVVKEQFALIGILVVLIGTVYTDYYYASFGLRYQSLSLPASHILYRGLTILRDAPYVALPYLIGIAVLVADTEESKRWVLVNRIRIAYVVFSIIIFLSYWLGSIAGRHAATRDLASGTSTLPKLVQISSGNDDQGPCSVPDSCRLLLIDGDYVYAFAPSDSPATPPNIIRFDRKESDRIITSTQ